jgi:UDP-N-acetylmuramyl pentapeptide phosphotransferase/UDP-N-acetylglucosamine-1-phosphate transferase
VLGSSFAMCGLLVLTQRWHGRLSLDNDLQGAQKLHLKPVPRIGGLGLAFGLLIAVITGYLNGGKTYPTTLVLLSCAMPVFLAGLMEDLTKKVSIRTRLVASFVSAALAIWMLDARLMKLDTVILDSVIQHPVLSIAFTIFAVGGVTQSINIVDGLNGLAAGTTSIMLAGLATIAWSHGDLLVMKLCLWGIASMGGFLILNYPFGRIFLGDGGAYLAGFWVAECAVLLLYRNPEISTWAVLLTCIYPVWETVFSMYRRSIRGRVNTSQADLGHLHHVLLLRLHSNRKNSAMRASWRSHALASIFIWGLVLTCQLLVLVAYPSGPWMAAGVFWFLLIYTWIYLMTSRSERTPPPTSDNRQRSAT